MLFNSYVFIFIFLPIVFGAYFLLNKAKLVTASNVWLVLSSVFFYGYWNPSYVFLILISILFNYALGSALIKFSDKDIKKAKIILIFGVIINLSSLGYYKYTDFFITNINSAFKTELPLLHLVLPLAISFFTFQQIAYLVDSYKKITKEYDFLNYMLFVTFFPQLIAGPIVHHKEMMPQFANLKNKILNFKNISVGLFIFSVGFFKKTVIADSFSVYVSNGFDNSASLNFAEAWIASLSYTFQLYFDFSGYTDMAIGAALLFNIKLPLNFNSPYKALNIQDFWRRWHITLSRWLRDYLYIPLGGNKKSGGRTYFNLIITFILGGFWHGAGWTFLIWGAMHGFGTAVHKFWQNTGIKIPKYIAWGMTFLFVHFAWVFFRAKSYGDAAKIFRGMFGQSGFSLPKALEGKLAFLNSYGVEFNGLLPNLKGGKSVIIFIFAAFLIIFMKNSIEISEKFKPNYIFSLATVILFLTGAFMLINNTSEFIYFNF